MNLSWVERHEEAIAEGQEAVKLDPLSIPANSSLGARFMLARQYDRAREQIERTLDEERSITLFGPNVEPAWDSLRSDPRFEALLRRMNFPPN